MAAKRRIRRGFATNILCVLRHEGSAPPEYFSKRFGHSAAAADRALRSLERQGLVRMSTVMSPGNYHLTDRGHGAVARSRACPGMGVSRRNEQYAPMRGARRKRRR